MQQLRLKALSIFNFQFSIVNSQLSILKFLSILIVVSAAIYEYIVGTLQF